MDIKLYNVKILNMFSRFSKSGKESNIQIKMYIDFAPDIQVFYHNYFFDEYKFKIKKAQEQGTKIITKEQFLNMVE